jgi:hypothetical protein
VALLVAVPRPVPMRDISALLRKSMVANALFLDEVSVTATNAT